MFNTSAKTVLLIPLLVISYTVVGGRKVFSQEKCASGQFEVSFYRNTNLRGKPAKIRCERVINHSWGSGGPVVDKGGVSGASGEMDGKSDGLGETLSDHFSARWIGKFRFDGGAYTFHVRADDGVRMWVDGRSLIDQWNLHSAQEFSQNIDLPRGIHEVKIEYFENDGDATINVWWDPAR